MLTLQNVQVFVKQLLTHHVPQRLRHRISCGVQAFSLQEFSSLNANGRSLALKRKTGESRVYRVIHDERTAPLLSKLILSLLPRSDLLYCSLDHSQFGPFCIAVLAVSLRQGRAIPIWIQVNVSEAALMAPLLTALEQLATQLLPDQRLVLVMDRWFCGPKLFDLIIRHEWYFICRAKYDRRVVVPWSTASIPIGEISQHEAMVAYHKQELRMIRSDIRPGMKQDEPWFLLTNVPSEGKHAASRVQILHRYEERFEIEEAFKDIKWLNRLEWQGVKKAESIQVLLLFTFLGWWLAWWCYQRDRQLQKQRKQTHHKQRLSWFRTIWELWRRLCWPEELRLTRLEPRAKRARGRSMAATAS